MININILYDNHKKVELDNNWLTNICRKILHDNYQYSASISIIISNDKKLLQLKKNYFDQDMLTDVIAFNLEEDMGPIEGEVYISFTRVLDNAKKYKQDSIIELKRVIIHGILHLTGYNDQSPEERQKMTELEDHYLDRNIDQN